MNLSAVVQFRNALAHYTLHREADGVYFAELESYEGQPAKAPPPTIMLTRGVRRWIGSFDNQQVLAELGQVIDGAEAADPLPLAFNITQSTSEQNSLREDL